MNQNGRYHLGWFPRKRSKLFVSFSTTTVNNNFSIAFYKRSMRLKEIFNIPFFSSDNIRPKTTIRDFSLILIHVNYSSSHLIFIHSLSFLYE